MLPPGPWSFFTWICTVKGWVVLQSFILAAGYFAVAWVMREIAFPKLKSIFENETVYNLVPPLREPLLGWIADVKILFYGALVYTAVGFTGFVGAILQIGMMLIPYAVYLLVAWIAAAKKIWEVWQTVDQVLDKLHEACDKVGALFGGNCDESFEKIQNYVKAGAAVITFLQATTLICVIVLIRRNKKKTGAYFWTICGKQCGGDRKSSDTDLEKGIPPGRRRRGARQALLAGGEAASRAEKVAAIPPAAFSLPRRPKRGAQPQSAPGPAATFELGRSRHVERRTSFSSRGAAATAFSSEADSSSPPSSPRPSTKRTAMRSLSKQRRYRRKGKDSRREEEGVTRDDEEGRGGSSSDGARRRRSGSVADGSSSGDGTDRE